MENYSPDNQNDCVDKIIDDKQRTSCKRDASRENHEDIHTQDCFIAPDSIGCGPLTYDYLIDRNRGLPAEYFEPTEIPYDPNEIAMYSIPDELAQKLDLDEGI